MTYKATAYHLCESRFDAHFYRVYETNWNTYLLPWQEGLTLEDYNSCS